MTASIPDPLMTPFSVSCGLVSQGPFVHQHWSLLFTLYVPQECDFPKCTTSHLFGLNSTHISLHLWPMRNRRVILISTLWKVYMDALLNKRMISRLYGYSLGFHSPEKRLGREEPKCGGEGMGRRGAWGGREERIIKEIDGYPLKMRSLAWSVSHRLNIEEQPLCCECGENNLDAEKNGWGKEKVINEGKLNKLAGEKGMGENDTRRHGKRAKNSLGWRICVCAADCMYFYIIMS